MGLELTGIVVIGTQFGDEGKGKITDFLSEKADIVARFQGGNNAGHTVKVAEHTVKLHHLPSGVMHNKTVMIGAGVIIDPKVLEEELKTLESIGKKPGLFIDPRCHIIMPWHNALDIAGEESNNGSIGTTKRGIGPCYADKCLRKGIRFEDLVYERRLEEAIERIFPEKKKILEKVYGKKIDFSAESVFKEYSRLGKKFAPFLKDVSFHVCAQLEKGKEILFEGAQGTFLDNDFGTYPYVTSSHPLSGGVATGIGIPINKISRVVGIVKAYTTRVGNGPFPTELQGKQADDLREKGEEFGTTTGRARRVGWLDIPMLRTAHRLNGFTELAITKLDVLSGMKELKVAVEYDIGGKIVKNFPYSTSTVEKAKPVYKTVKGFTLSGKEKKFSELPKEAKDYLKLIEESLGVPVKFVSVGPERNETIIC